jgi:Xaa-Pro aminopeptidase
MSVSAIKLPRLSIDERDRRWQAARELMDEEDVDALIVFGDRAGSGTPLWAYDHWLTNYWNGSYVVFPRTGVPIAHYFAINPMVAHMESVRSGDPVWLSADQLRLGRTAEGVLKTIRDLKLEGAKFGIIGNGSMPPFFSDGMVPWGTYQPILDSLPKASFKPLEVPYGRLVATRSAEELDMLRKSAADGEKMCEAAIEATRVGAKDADVFAAASAAGIRAGSWVWTMYLVLGNDDISWGAPDWVYRGGGPREILSGDTLLLETMPFYGFYETQQKLAIAVGDVNPDVERAAAVAEKSYDVGLQALRDGVATFGEVDAAMTSVITDAGGWNSTPNVKTLPPQAIGAFGPREPQPWMEPYHEISQRGRNPSGGAELEIEPGMFITMQPSCIVGHNRVMLGGSLLTTADGVEELNDVCNRLVRVDG